MRSKLFIRWITIKLWWMCVYNEFFNVDRWTILICNIYYCALKDCVGVHMALKITFNTLDNSNLSCKSILSRNIFKLSIFTSKRAPILKTDLTMILGLEVICGIWGYLWIVSNNYTQSHKYDNTIKSHRPHGWIHSKSKIH